MSLSIAAYRQAGDTIDDADVDENADIEISKLGTRTLLRSIPATMFQRSGAGCVLTNNGVYGGVIMPDANDATLYIAFALPDEWESGDIVIVFTAESGDRLMEDGGRVLEALEHLVNVARAKGDRSVPRVTFQVEGQAPRETGGVVGQACAAVEEVKRSGEKFKLAPMDSRERRLVHQALAGHPDVETVSEGEGSNRKIVIRPKQRQD